MSLFAKQIPVTEITMTTKRKPQLIETHKKRLLLIIPRSFLLWNTVSAREKKINLEELETREIKAGIYKGKNAKAKKKWHEVLGIPGSLCKLEDVMLSEWFPVYMFCILICHWDMFLLVVAANPLFHLKIHWICPCWPLFMHNVYLQERPLSNILCNILYTWCHTTLSKNDWLISWMQRQIISILRAVIKTCLILYSPVSNLSRPSLRWNGRLKQLADYDIEWHLYSSNQLD